MRVHGERTTAQRQQNQTEHGGETQSAVSISAAEVEQVNRCHCSSHTSRLLNKAQKGSTETSEGEFTEQILLEQ